MKIYNSPDLNNLPIKNPLCYTEDEINSLFDLSEEESVELTKVINDSHIAINKVYSNSKTEERLAEILIEANEFATEQLGKSNFLSIDIVTSVDEVLDDTVIYLIDDGTSTNTYNQYVLIGGNVTPLGSTQCDLTNYVTNDQLETKLEDYAKKNEVLSASDIVTTIDDTVTDAQVVGALTVYEATKDKNIKTFTTLDQLGLSDGCDVTEIVNAMPEHSYAEIGCYNATNSYGLEFVTGLPNGEANFILTIRKYNLHRVDIQAKSSASGAVMNDLYVGGMVAGGTSVSWKRVCTTSVKDVGKTVLTLTDSTNYKVSTDIDENNCYTVKNGICQVNIDMQCLTATTIHNVFNETLPTPYAGKYMASISSLYSDYTDTDASYRPITLVIYDNLTILYGGSVGGRYFGSISYPVASE